MTWNGYGADPGPEKGLHDEKASQPQREVCFWHAAQVFSLNDDIPRCELLSLDGKMYACQQFLTGYSPLEDLREEDSAKMTLILDRYLNAGKLHQWGLMDAVLGNTDRHYGNILYKDESIKLIDHGAAFAGENFDPAVDSASFIPCYLRYRSPDNLHILKPSERLARMERAPPSVSEMLRSWLSDLRIDKLADILTQYGIHPKPSIDRLKAFQGSDDPVDLAVCLFWANK